MSKLGPDSVGKPRKEKDKGAALVSVLMMSLVLFSFIIAISILMNQRFHSINLRQSQNKAKYAAQAGLTRSLEELSNDAFWETGYAKTPLAGDPQVFYVVDVFNNFDGSKGGPDAPGAYAPDGVTWVPRGTVWIRSVGISGDVTQGSVGLVGVMGQFRPSFDHAVFGDESVVVSGTSLVDSVPPDQADVGSNALVGPAITISSNSTVRGRAICGPTADPNSPGVIQIISSTILGREAANESKVIVPMVNFQHPVGTPPLDLTLQGGASYNLVAGEQHNYGTFSLDNSTLLLSSSGEPTIPRGVYYLDGDLTLTNNSTIMIDYADENNPAVLYVGGTATFDNSVVGVDELGNPIDPRSLQIYFTEQGPGSPASSLVMTNNSSGNFVAAGDDLDIQVTNSTLRGALIGRNIEIVSSSLLYTSSLDSVPLDGRGEVTLLSTDPVPPNVAQAIAQNNPPPPAPPAPPDPPRLPDPPGMPVALPAPAPPGSTVGAAVVAAPPVAPPPATTAPPTTVPAPTAPPTAPPTTVPAPTAPPTAPPTTVPAPTAPPSTTSAPPTTAPPPIPTTVPAPPAPVTTAPPPIPTTVPAPPAPVTTVPSITTTGPNGSGGTVIAPAPTGGSGCAGS